MFHCFAESGQLFIVASSASADFVGSPDSRPSPARYRNGLGAGPVSSLTSSPSTGISSTFLVKNSV